MKSKKNILSNPDQHIEKYLKQATRGLHGQTRQQVYSELKANLEQMAQDEMIRGVPREDAVCLALKAMGKPQRIAAGMREVHVVPLASKGMALALFAGALLMAAPSVAQNVQVLTEGAFPNCTSQKTPEGLWCYANWRGKTWVSMASLKAQLTAQGATLQERTLTVPVANRAERTVQDLQISQLEITLPDGKNMKLNSVPRFSPVASGGPELLSRFERDGELFVDTSEVLWWFQKTSLGTPITLLDPLGEATLQFAGIQLRFGNEQGAVSVKDHLLALGEKTLNGDWELPYQVHPDLHFNEPASSGKSVRTHPHTVKVDAPAGTAYWIVHQQKVGDLTFWVLDVARVDRQQMLAFRSVHKNPVYARTLKGWNNASEPRVALLKFTGQINRATPYTISLPLK